MLAVDTAPRTFGPSSMLDTPVASPLRRTSSQSSRPSSSRRGSDAGSAVVNTRHGQLRGRVLPNGASAWLAVPYALPTRRWTPTRPLPADYQYDRTDYSTYGPQAAQPALWLLPMSLKNDQAILGPPEQPFSENCLTLDIFAPPGATPSSNLPVTVWIHGGYLQTGSPSCHLNEPSEVIAIDPARIWVCVTYRLSVFGFLAAETPRLSGNFGFMDQWQALLWTQANIASFGGDPSNVTLMGQSAGAHSTQQHLHHASRLPDDVPLPFQSAHMISNGISVQPKSLSEAQLQFDAFCKQLGVDPAAPDAVSQLRAFDTKTVTNAIEALGGKGAFRGVTDGGFVSHGLLDWQRSGQLANSLARKGFKRLIIGETVCEDLGGVCPSYDFLYAVATSSYGSRAGQIAIKRSSASMTSSAVELSLANRAMLSDMQIHVGARMLAKALWREPRIDVVRYMLAWAPAGAKAFISRDGASVTHGADLPIWFHRTEYMTPEEAEVATQWRRAIAEAGRAPSERHHLVLSPSGVIAVAKDARFEGMDQLERDLAES